MQPPNPGSTDVEILVTRWKLAERNRTGRDPSTAEIQRARAWLQSLPPEQHQQLISLETPPVIPPPPGSVRRDPALAGAFAGGQAESSATDVVPPVTEPIAAPTAEPAPPANAPPQTAGGRIQFSPFDDVFLKYTPPDLQGDDTFRAIVAAGTFAESGWDPNKPGDYENGVPQSLGLFQMHARGAGAGMGQARADPDAASRAMLPRYAQAYKQIRAQFPTATGSHLAALVAGMAERPQGVDSAGILQAGTTAYSNYVNGWNHVAGGGGARPIGGPSQTPSTRLPPITGAQLQSPGGVLGAITDTWAEAEAQIAALGEFPDPTRVTAITQGAKAQSDLLTWYQDRADKSDYQTAANEIAAGHLRVAQGNLALGREGLAQQRDFHNDDVRLALARMAQEAGIALGSIDGKPTLAMQQYLSNLEQQAFERQTALAGLSGNLPEEYGGGRTIAGQTLDLAATREQREADQYQLDLRRQFAELQQRGATELGAAQGRANQLRLATGRSAAIAGPGGEFVRGYEPGGAMERSAQLAGSAFTPLRMADLATVDPEAGLRELAARIAAAEAQHPGNPLMQFAGAR